MIGVTHVCDRRPKYFVPLCLCALVLTLCTFPSNLLPFPIVLLVYFIQQGEIVCVTQLAHLALL